MRRGLRSIGIVVALAMAIPAGMPAVCAAAPRRFIEPVDGGIGRRFERPLGPYAEGHRGVDFMVEEGSEVVASSAGEVSFAGPVAGNLFVTIDHGGGLDTTYSFLSEASVSAGDEVGQGDLIALSGPGHEGEEPSLHFGARLHDIYLDPEILLYGNLDDISRALSLAPLDEPSYADDAVGGGGSSALQPIEMPELSNGFFISIGEGIGKAGSWLAELPGRAWDWLGDGWDATSRGLGEAERTGAGWLGGAWDFLASGWDEATDRIGDSLSRQGAWLSSAFDRIGSALSTAWDWLKSATATFGGWLSSGWDWLVGAAGATWDGITSAVEAIGRFFSRIPGWLDAGWEWTKHWVADDWQDTLEFFAWTWDLVEVVVDGLIWTMDAIMGVLEDVAIALDDAVDWLAVKVMDGLRWLWGQITKTSAGRLVDSVIRMLDSLAILPHLIPAAIEQVQCSRDASPPPDLPTTEELDAGAEPPPPPNDNILVAVAGIGSQTSFDEDGEVETNASIYDVDFRTLGYTDDQLYFYSYAGVGEGGPGPYRIHEPYSKEDSQQSIRDAALKLARMVDKVSLNNPDHRIDLVAHSQGGLVVEYYLARFHDSVADKDLEVESFVSLGTPHDGADLASIDSQLGRSPGGIIQAKFLDSLSGMLGAPSPGSSSVREMDPESQFIREIGMMRGPDEIRRTAIATAFDVVVPTPRSRPDGTAIFTVDLDGGSGFWAHGGIVNSDDAKTIMYLSLAGKTPMCTPIANALSDHGVGQAISAFEDFVIGMSGVLTQRP